MRSWVALVVVCFLLSATAGEKDTWQNSSEKLKHWRHVKKLAEYDRPARATLQSSALGNRQEHQSDVVPVPTNLTHADSDADTAGQHGIDQPAIVIDLPVIECECEYSYGSVATTLAGMEQDGDASSMESIACNAESRVCVIFLVRDLVPGFVYEVQFECEWSGQDEYNWKTEFTPSTRSYTVKLSLDWSQKTRALNSQTSMWDTYIPQKDAFEIEVTVRDMHPGLTSEEALIGTRRVNSAVNTVRVRCANLESGERMPDGGEGEWKYNFSAAAEDVRISHYSETKKNVLLSSMRNDMRRWFSCLLCFFVLSAANAIQKDPPPKSSEKLKHWRHVKQFAEYDAQDKKTTTKTLEELAEPPRYLAGRSADTSKLCRSRDLQAVREEGRGETCGEVVNGVSGIRISIDAPLAGQTLVSGGETEVKISINVENGAYEDLELRVMAHSDVSHSQLYRAPVLLNADLQHTYINLTSDVKLM
jgi:hypothetical protein